MIGRSPLWPVLHQVLEQSGFSRGIISAGREEKCIKGKEETRLYILMHCKSKKCWNLVHITWRFADMSALKHNTLLPHWLWTDSCSYESPAWEFFSESLQSHLLRTTYSAVRAKALPACFFKCLSLISKRHPWRTSSQAERDVAGFSNPTCKSRHWTSDLTSGFSLRARNCL